MPSKTPRLFRVVARNTLEPVLDDDGKFIESGNPIAAIDKIVGKVGAPRYQVKKAYTVIEIHPEEDFAYFHAQTGWMPAGVRQ